MRKGQEAKIRDGAAYVIARQRVSVQASDGEGLETTVYLIPVRDSYSASASYTPVTLILAQAEWLLASHKVIYNAIYSSHQHEHY